MNVEDFEKTATKVSLVSILGNLVLSAFKLIAGIVAHSSAMVSDSVHSASDVFSSVIVIIGVKLSTKESDKKHPYGHERYECVAAVILAIVLVVIGCFIGYFAIEKIISGEYDKLVVPGKLALAAGFASIVVKEAMYWYTRHYAKKTNSSALMADAWHHRSDALSSVGAIIGIGGAILGVPVLEPIASLVICIFILKAAIEVLADAMNKMVDHYAGDELENKITDFVLNIDGVERIDVLRTRLFGRMIYVDIEIGAKTTLSLHEGHMIAETVHDEIEKEFPYVKHIMVHVNPAE